MYLYSYGFAQNCSKDVIENGKLVTSGHFTVGNLCFRDNSSNSRPFTAIGDAKSWPTINSWLMDVYSPPK